MLVPSGCMSTVCVLIRVVCRWVEWGGEGERGGGSISLQGVFMCVYRHIVY